MEQITIALIYKFMDDMDRQSEELNYCDTNCTLGKRDEMFDDGYVRSAPVGSYPEGASWVGALDLAGNVWELGVLLLFHKVVLPAKTPYDIMCSAGPAVVKIDHGMEPIGIPRQRRENEHWISQNK